MQSNLKESYLEALNRASSALKEVNKDVDALKWLLLERKNWNLTNWLLNMHKPIASADQIQLASDTQQLLNDYPPQYILGYGYFMDQKFKVNSATLIPRPETEELVVNCLKHNSAMKNLTIADIGTGTGCIGIILKQERPNWHVIASDISSDALAVAKENALIYKTDIDFRLGDGASILENSTVDIVISNPPYIDTAEWNTMDASVRKYEPKTALFAEHQGLAIYEQLANELPSKLTTNGQIFLEIGWLQGKAVQKLFQQAFPEKMVQLLPDLSGLDRMIWVN